MKNQTSETKKMKVPLKGRNKSEKALPWWVELLFVQIGLPDKFLIKILKANKNIKELFKNDKKFIFTSLFFLTILAYFYPVVKQSKNILECEVMARNYIIENKKPDNLKGVNLKMLSTNFCNGGEEIFEIENIKR